MFKKAVLLIVIITWNLGCERCPSVLPHFKIESMDSSIRSMADGTNNGSATEENDTIHWENLEIRVSFEMSFHASIENRNGKLYALSCDSEGHEGTLVGVQSFKIISNNDYNENYLANDTLNNIIEIKKSNSIYQSMSEYLTENQEIIKSPYIRIYLDESPTMEISEQSFKIIYALNNGETFETVTPAVFISN